jgi:hypothetical protein
LCGLCAGLLGRSIKNVQIQNHYWPRVTITTHEIY